MVRLANRRSHSADGMKQSGRMASRAREIFVKKCRAANSMRAGVGSDSWRFGVGVGGASAWP